MKGRNQHSLCTPDEEIEWCEVRRTRWQSNRAASADPFQWQLSIQEVLPEKQRE